MGVSQPDYSSDSSNNSYSAAPMLENNRAVFDLMSQLDWESDPDTQGWEDE